MALTKPAAPKRLGAVFAALVLAAACLYPAQGSKSGRPGLEKKSLIPVPFEKWLSKNCSGPACLAMVLNYWNAKRPFSQRRILAEIHDGENHEVDSSEMVLYPRTNGFASYSFQGDLGILKQVVGTGIPVIVLPAREQKIARGNYLVVIGYDAENDQIVFHDPGLGARQALASARFLEAGERENRRGQYCWMMAVAPAQRPFPFPALQHDPLTYVNLSTAYYHRSDFMRARAELENAGQSGPFPLYSLAMASLREGRAAEAEAYARQALSLYAESAYAHDVLGLAYASQGRVDQALQSLSQALRLAPGEKSIAKHYQQVKALRGDWTRTDFQKKGESK